VRQALEHPLNYARNYLAELLEPCVRRFIYLDSDLVLVDDVAKLWRTDLGGRTVGALEYCHTNFTKYFTGRFWLDQRFAGTFVVRRSCYFTRASWCSTWSGGGRRATHSASSGGWRYRSR
jgi:hypothetical protein